ncbi:SecDF P1 head subdomain-containing protein [Inquilinus sp. OTU3971]|uniref:SecDF P1 head subdomain-containing protein n=1 Tax=Inquilinus sp. OTU3971 TaxID=3043855 RepID=UPI00313D9C84
MLSIVSTLTVAAMVLAAALTVPLPLPQPAVPPVTAAIEFRLAQAEPGPGLTAVEKDGRTLYLQPQVIISTPDIASAEQSFDPLWGQPVVSLELNSAGRDRLAAFTATHIGRTLAIIVDGALVTAPVIQSVIPDGRLQISGVQSLAEAMDLAGKLGRSPAPSSRSLADSLRGRFERL